MMICNLFKTGLPLAKLALAGQSGLGKHHERAVNRGITDTGIFFAGFGQNFFQGKMAVGRGKKNPGDNIALVGFFQTLVHKIVIKIRQGAGSLHGPHFKKKARLLSSLLKMTFN